MYKIPTEGRCRGGGWSRRGEGRRGGGASRHPCYVLQVIRYNRLLSTIQSTLNDLLKALKGLVVMSQELETMFNSLYNNSVPALWAAKAGFQGILRLLHGTPWAQHEAVM